MTTHRQFAALPWIETREGLHILLITSRDTGRWVIPKGWPKKGCDGAQVAELEAFEEAGVSGLIGEGSCGQFSYRKSLHFFSRVMCEVDVFPLMVTQQRLKWPERRERRLQWMLAGEAAAAVREPELSRMIANFRPGSALLTPAAA